MNKTPKRFRTRFENTMENPIFNFFLFWSKRSNFVFYIRNMDLLISKLLSNSILDIGKWSNWNYAQLRICVFSVWPLPKVKNWFQKQFWNEKVHITALKKSLKAFWWKEKKVNKWITHYIFKNGFVRCRWLFSHLRGENWYNGLYRSVTSGRDLALSYVTFSKSLLGCCDGHSHSHSQSVTICEEQRLFFQLIMRDFVY